MGSSKNSTEGSCSSARVMASFCFMPLLNWPTGWSRLSHSSNSRRSFSMRSARTLRRETLQLARRTRGSAQPTAGRRARGLGQQADPPADLFGRLDDVEAVEPRPALARRDQRGEQADRGRLAGAVGAEQAEDLAGVELEVEAANRPQVAEPPAQALGADHRSWVGGLGCLSGHGGPRAGGSRTCARCRRGGAECCRHGSARSAPARSRRRRGTPAGEIG